MLEIHPTSCNSWKNSSKVFVCWKTEIFYFLFKGQKTSVNAGSQSSKGILATKFAKTTHFFFNVNSYRFGLSSSIFDTFKVWILTCLFVSINFELLLKWSLKEQLKNHFYYLLKVLLLSLISKYSIL